jgi:tetratricopeptide (TPR) repeat protein
MQSIIERFSKQLEHFVEQRNTAVAFVRCRAEDNLVLLSLLDQRDRDPSVSDVFWSFFEEPFETPRQYAASILRGLKTRFDALRDGLAAADLVYWKPFEPAQDGEPMGQLRSALSFLRDTVRPESEQSRLVVALLPGIVDQPQQFYEFVRSLASYEHPRPWCHHIRFIVREVPEEPLPEDDEWAYRAELNLSQPRIVAALEGEAEDSRLPMLRRIHAAFILGGFDVSAGRLDEALDKLSLVRQYCSISGLDAMEAAASQQIGDVYRMRGDLKGAQREYEASIDSAVRSKDPLVVLRAAQSLGAVKRAEGNWSEAIPYLERARGLGVLCRSPVLLIQCDAHLADCLSRVGREVEAAVVYERAASLAREADNKAAQLWCLRRLLDLREGSVDLSDEIEALDAQEVSTKEVETWLAH